MWCTCLLEHGARGDGIGIAVIDSRISSSKDFSNLKRSVSFSTNSTANVDFFGHGTHVAAIIAGSGANADGLYSGVAPNAHLYNLKIADDTAMTYESDMLAACNGYWPTKQPLISGRLICPRMRCQNSHITLAS